MKLGDILVLILAGVILLVLSPIILTLSVVSYFQERVKKKRFEAYLRTHEGAKFFAYTNKPSSQEFIKSEILPALSNEVEVLYLCGKGRINLGDEHEFAARIVWLMKKAKGGFPYVSKIVNGELVTESVNSRLYSAVKRGVGGDKVREQIEKFFS